MKYPRKVYAIRHNITNKVYIGSSNNVDKRLYDHMSALKSGRHPVGDMQKDYNKYGDNYTFTILDVIKNKSEKNKEYEWAQRYQSNLREIGYNYQDQKWKSLAGELEEEDTLQPLTYVADNARLTKRDELMVRNIAENCLVQGENPVIFFILAGNLVIKEYSQEPPLPPNFKRLK